MKTLRVFEALLLILVAAASITPMITASSNTGSSPDSQAVRGGICGLNSDPHPSLLRYPRVQEAFKLVF
ncbi:hypothetical protein [Thermosphaera aggregans]|uniref:hypothetical protein n=1 Tax=Thermosphaera aggregans TaxID=54254 RepID=UPI0011E5068C|nr:hypothetical protein [Thermosphaera aggregans]